MPTAILRELKRICTENGIKHLDAKELKPFGGEHYYPLKKHLRCNYLAHIVTPTECLEICIPNDMKMEDVKRDFGLTAYDSPNNASCHCVGHYWVRIAMKNGLLDGKHSVEQKKAFFVEVMKKR